MAQKHYETTIIFTPDLSDADIGKKVAQYTKLLKDKNAKIIHLSTPTTQNLAYPIQKKKSGTYQTIHFTSPPQVINTLETHYQRDPEILRFLTVSLNKHALTYKQAQQQKDQQQTTPNPQQNQTDE